MILDRVLAQGWPSEERRQFCFLLPEDLKKEFELVAKAHGKTMTSLMLGAMMVMIQEFKGGDISTLTTAEARVYFELEKLEEKLEPYLVESDNQKGFEHRGYKFNEDAQEYTIKIDNLLDRIERLKKMIKEDVKC